jgi:hypothetical protein
LAQLEKDYKDRIRRLTWKAKPGKSTTTTTTTTTNGTIETEDGEGGGEEEEAEEGRGDRRDVGGKSIETYDQELIDRKIREIEEKWKIKVEQLENEKVFCFYKKKLENF